MSKRQYKVQEYEVHYINTDGERYCVLVMATSLNDAKQQVKRRKNVKKIIQASISITAIQQCCCEDCRNK